MYLYVELQKLDNVLRHLTVLNAMNYILSHSIAILGRCTRHKGILEDMQEA